MNDVIISNAQAIVDDCKVEAKGNLVLSVIFGILAVVWWPGLIFLSYWEP